MEPQPGSLKVLLFLEAWRRRAAILTKPCSCTAGLGAMPGHRVCFSSRSAPAGVAVHGVSFFRRPEAALPSGTRHRHHHHQLCHSGTAPSPTTTTAIATTTRPAEAAAAAATTTTIPQPHQQQQRLMPASARCKMQEPTCGSIGPNKKRHHDFGGSTISSTSSGKHNDNSINRNRNHHRQQHRKQYSEQVGHLSENQHRHKQHYR